MKVFLTVLLMGMILVVEAAPKGQSPIISLSKNGKLAYDADTRGNRVPDFSSCGYVGGNEEIPSAPVSIVVAPTKGDETARLQKAIDYVAGLPAGSNGVRGAVLLLKGRHEVSGGLQITNSGVVLRGQGASEDETILVAVGTDRRTLITISGRGDRVVRSNENWQISDDYVPVGADHFHVKDASGLKVGDSVNIIRPCIKSWIGTLGAEDFGGGEGGGWKPGSRDLVWDRVVTSIDGNLVGVDAPITTAIETNFGGGELKTYSWPGRIQNVGVENMRLESSFDSSNTNDENHSWMAITMENAQDVWVRQVTFRHFAGSAVAIYETCKRVTVEDCLSLAPVSENGGYRRNTFFTMGQQTLFLRCCAEHGRHDFSVGHCAAGPNAFVQCEANSALDDSGGIESWSSGSLFDNVRIDGNALTLGYRAGNNSGIGWAAANSVLWNCDASVIRCWNPPGAQNWSFGSWGGFEGDGNWRNSNGFMKPESLYVEQLVERTGRRTQIMSRVTRESSNPTVEEAAELIAASHRPAPQLVDFIATAGNRNRIPSEPGTAPRIETIPDGPRAPKVERHAISITNGWITCDGKLLIGGCMELTWWRGSIRPDEAASFGPALTRFVPGRVGPGFTDDIQKLADLMAQHGDAALDHHYGLWYDLRRDDHERVRRMDGDVLPPFFEQPFARTGEGKAWDGLSKYDLTKFNPWYWGRLKKFAEIADQHGLVLFNENYFQHNIIEAGAHWVDCPWRTANNINNTGFPEPPPFAGDKRIFMAEQFYDVNNSLRRALHRGFIRQNLDNFKDNANVIQFTSAEFSGPVHFVQFWLDTIHDWEKEHKHNKVLVALAAPKNVQDAILTDAKRAAIVDVIAFRYWWQSDRGLYAPDGGQDLAPRQFQRQLGGTPPTDVDLATMAQEYHTKFPSKPVIAASEQGLNLSHSGWAYVCAGGSMPNLPGTTDATLLAAIPRMRPWIEASREGKWVLREPGKQHLIYSTDTSAELDLASESGAFLVRAVNIRTGEIATEPQTIQAGGKVSLPRGVIWLTKAK
ncbi:MAG TPA: DUF6298 domain-containing protein [Verrucomicrobiae bacterium]|nr:DUF6298 domain-containing protein [Verrucomicrobiae bacterium]